jgi:hypothetical protein
LGLVRQGYKVGVLEIFIFFMVLTFYPILVH